MQCTDDNSTHSWQHVFVHGKVRKRTGRVESETAHLEWIESRMIHYLARQIVGMNVPEDSPAIAEIKRDAWEKCKEG